jgi:hypothetical protein
LTFRLFRYIYYCTEDKRKFEENCIDLLLQRFQIRKREEKRHVKKLIRLNDSLILFLFYLDGPVGLDLPFGPRASFFFSFFLNDGESVADSGKAGPPYKAADGQVKGRSISRKEVAHFIFDAVTNHWDEYGNKQVSIRVAYFIYRE